MNIMQTQRIYRYMECGSDRVSIDDIKEKLKFGNPKIIFDINEYVQTLFDSYYSINEDDFVIIMNLLVNLCIRFKYDRDLTLQLLETLEIGVGRQGTNHVKFEPLVELLNDNDIDYLWRVIIILGFSCQSQYIKVLQDIKTNDSFIKKEISDAIYELKMGYKII